MGFAPDVGRILSRTPDSRQTALFSATMPGAIRGMVKRHMRSPRYLTVESEAPTVDTVEQVYYRVDGKDKTRTLRALIDAEQNPLAIVFRRTKHGATKLHRQLERNGYKAALLHGGKSQSQRTKTLAGFAKGRSRILVATNVASRGLDIPDVSHVVNYDLPEDAETYVHRIGRTARAGKEGVAATLVGEAEVREFNKIQRPFPSKCAGAIYRSPPDPYSSSLATKLLCAEGIIRPWTYKPLEEYYLERFVWHEQEPTSTKPSLR